MLVVVGIEEVAVVEGELFEQARGSCSLASPLEPVWVVVASSAHFCVVEVDNILGPSG